MKTVAALTTLFLFASIVASAQDRVLYHENPFDRTFTKCQKPPTFGKDSLDLQKYLADKLHDRIPKTEGQITISVLIDTAGKPLCEWIENNSNLNIKRAKLDAIVDSMPNWHCAIQNGYKVDCAEIVEMTFNKQDLGVIYKLKTEIR